MFADYRFTTPKVLALVVPGFPRQCFLHPETAQMPRLHRRDMAGRVRQPRPPVNRLWLPAGCSLPPEITRSVPGNAHLTRMINDRSTPHRFPLKDKISERVTPMRIEAITDQ